METQTKTGGGAKDFFINLGAIVALYTMVVSLVNLLFTIINTVYPQITNGYNYSGSASISWPVATLVIFFPIFILLMWLLEKEYTREPERKNMGIHKWLTYITLFIAGLTIAGDLITVLYYFLDGQELTTGFLLKVVVLLVVASSIFVYYISDVRDKLTPKKRIFWRIIAGVIILGSIVWGFSVLGSPATQRLYKYDQQKVNDLMNINNEVANYYSINGALPASLAGISSQYNLITPDTQTGKPYEYAKTGDLTYNLCAVFNKASTDGNYGGAVNIAYPIGGISGSHPAGHYCFAQTINPNMYSKPVPLR
jgi:hypothetical protein